MSLFTTTPGSTTVGHASRRAVAPALLGALALAGAAPVHGQSAGQWSGPEQIYRSACVYCHDTGVAPVLRGRGLDPAYVRDRVRKGFGPMPAFKPSEIDVQELERLGAWLRDSAPAGAP